MSRILSVVNELAHARKGNASEWLSSAEEGIAFLKQNAMASTMVLYASVGSS